MASKRHGPATGDEIADLIAHGSLPQDVPVWREGMPSWSPANTVAGVRSKIPPPAPPPEPGAASGPPVAVVDVHQGSVMIWPDRVTWGTTTLLASEITGIRYGVVVTKVIGLLSTNRQYTVALTDGRNTISIDRYNLFVGGKVEERFKALLDALSLPVIEPLIRRMLDSVIRGPGFQLEDPGVLATGRLRVDKSGLHWTPGRTLGLFERGGDFVPWSEYHSYSLHQGRIHLFRTTAQRAWLSFGLIDSWNAVCLGPALSAALKTGIVSQVRG